MSYRKRGGAVVNDVFVLRRIFRHRYVIQVAFPSVVSSRHSASALIKLCRQHTTTVLDDGRRLWLALQLWHPSHQSVACLPDSLSDQQAVQERRYSRVVVRWSGNCLPSLLNPRPSGSKATSAECCAACALVAPTAAAAAATASSILPPSSTLCLLSPCVVAATTLLQHACRNTNSQTDRQTDRLM